MNSRQRRKLRRLSERMCELCDLTMLRISQDVEAFLAACRERRELKTGGLEE